MSNSQRSVDSKSPNLEMLDFLHCQMCGRLPNTKNPIIVGKCLKTYWKVSICTGVVISVVK